MIRSRAMRGRRSEGCNEGGHDEEMYRHHEAEAVVRHRHLIIIYRSLSCDTSLRAACAPLPSARSFVVQTKKSISKLIPIFVKFDSFLGKSYGGIRSWLCLKKKRDPLVIWGE